MNNPPEFLRPGFTMPAPAYCEHEGDTTMHTFEMVAHTDNHVQYYKTCNACKLAYERLLGLGVDMPSPRKADVIPIAEYVFLVLRPADILA